MASCEPPGFVYLKANSIEETSWCQRRICAACCSILGGSAMVLLYWIAPGTRHAHTANMTYLVGKIHSSSDSAVQFSLSKPFVSLPHHYLQFASAHWLPQRPGLGQARDAGSARHFAQPAGVADSIDAAMGFASSAADAKKAIVFGALNAGSEAAMRAALAAALPALEASNPTLEPAFSTKLLGRWAVRYTGGVAPGPIDSPTREIALLMYAAGFGPSNAALSLANRLPNSLVQVKTVSLQLMWLPTETVGESRATLGLRLFGVQEDVNVSLLSKLVATGPSKLTERGKEVRVHGGAQVGIPDQLQVPRDLYLTYLDDELLVARDATGSPDIFVREASAFAVERPVQSIPIVRNKDELEIPVDTQNEDELEFEREENWQDLAAQEQLARSVTVRQIVPVPMELCYDMLADVEKYPLWMPFVMSGQILGPMESEVAFGIDIGAFGKFSDSVRYTMTLRQPTNLKNGSVATTSRVLSDSVGGFRYGSRLVWDWRFTAMSESETEVRLDMFWQANSALLPPVWDAVAQTVLSNFLLPAAEKRSKTLLEESKSNDR